MKPKYIVGIVGLVQNDIRPLPAPPPVHSSHNVTAASARMLLLRARAGLPGMLQRDFQLHGLKGISKTFLE